MASNRVITFFPTAPTSFINALSTKYWPCVFGEFAWMMQERYFFDLLSSLRDTISVNGDRRINFIVDNSTHLTGGKPFNLKYMHRSVARYMDYGSQYDTVDRSDYKTVLIVPDVKNDTNRTIELATYWAPFIQGCRRSEASGDYMRECHYQFMPVVQGTLFSEYVACYKSFKQHEIIFDSDRGYLALPYQFTIDADYAQWPSDFKDISDRVWNSILVYDNELGNVLRHTYEDHSAEPHVRWMIHRVIFARWLAEIRGFEGTLHLLGLREPIELKIHSLWSDNPVTSCDSSLAYTTALGDVPLLSKGGLSTGIIPGSEITKPLLYNKDGVTTERIDFANFAANYAYIQNLAY